MKISGMALIAICAFVTFGVLHLFGPKIGAYSALASAGILLLRELL